MDSRSALPPPTLPPPVRPPEATTPPSIALRPAVPSAAPRMAPRPHTPIDIAALRRPKRRIRSTVITTTVVGVFLAGSTTGVVLAWRRISDKSTDAATAAVVSPDEASRHWKPVSHGDFVLKVPDSATLETEADGTTSYTTMVDNLKVSIGPYHASLVGHEEEWAHQAIGNFATQLPGTLGPIETIPSIGPAYKAIIAVGQGQVVHVRLLFVANTMVFIVGQGDSTAVEPWPVTAAWNSITYKGAPAYGA